MSAIWKTVLVFISSTFRDMQAERDWLVRFVFPKLREELLKYRIHLVDVDLRWGVTGDQDALGVCREVIDECHPRFMCMLGGRYGWVPEGQDKSITADEIHYGVLGREAENRGQAFFYFRDDRATARMAEATSGDFREPAASDSARKLADLKQAITDAGLPVHLYDAQWDAVQKRLTGLEALGNQVHADLLRSLTNDPDLVAHFATESNALPDEFAEEAEQMDAFIEDRTIRYIAGSREPLLRDMLAFAADDGMPNIFAITGDPGSGKSAFLAKLTRDLTSESFATHHPSFVIPHFIGASTGSTDLRRTLRRLCHELALAASNTEPLPLNIKDLITHFQKLLAEAAGGRRVILIFDALNQLDAMDGAHWLNWLPRELPPGVRIVASVVAPADGQAEHEMIAILRARPGTRMEKLELLTEADTLAIIEGSLRRYAKRLSPEQLAAILAKPAGRLPLYVLTALEELRTLGTYEEITDRIRTLPGDARALFGWILTERLARDTGFRDHEGRPCGAALVEKFAACLGVSRHGLSPAELTAVLDPGDPQGNVASLLRLLRPYLMHRGELLDFYHGQFREAAQEAWLRTEPQARASHQHLADYFTACAKGSAPQKEWETESVRGFGECVFHRIKAGQLDTAVGLLLSFPFLLHKLRVGLLEGVFEDYAILGREASAEMVVSLRIWTDFFHEKAHILRRESVEWPAHRILLQLAVEHADESPITLRAEQWLAEGHCGWCWLRRVPRPSQARPKSCLSVLEGHTRSISGALLLPNGQLLSWACDAALRIWDCKSGRCLHEIKGHESIINGAALLPDGNFFSWSQDGTIRFWDAQSTACLGVFRDRISGSITGTLVLPDKARLLSWNYRWVRVWNLKEQTLVASLEGHSDTINGVLVLGDGKLLTFSADRTLRVWDIDKAVCVFVLEGHSQRVIGAAMLPDDRVVSWSGDGTLRIWNVKNGASLHLLYGHAYGDVEGALVLADGRLLSWSVDGTLRIWETKKGKCVAVMEGHTNAVQGVIPLIDGRLLSWSCDRTLRIWDPKAYKCRAVLKGHTSLVTGAVELPGGRIASWSMDNTMRVWDLRKGVCIVTLEGHTKPIKEALALPEERLLSWSFDESLRVWATVSIPKPVSRVRHSEPILGSLNFVGTLDLADGRVLSWSGDHTLKVWDASNGSCRVTMKGHEDCVKGASYFPDHGLIVSWSTQDVLVWNAERMVAVCKLEGENSFVQGGLILPDQRLLTWGEIEQRLKLWDRSTGKCLAVIEGLTSGLKGARLLADGRVLVWSYSGTVYLWHPSADAPPVLLQGHEKALWGAVLLEDGTLLTGSYDGTLGVWDLGQGKRLERLSGQEAIKERPDWIHRLFLTAEAPPICSNFFAVGSGWSFTTEVHAAQLVSRIRRPNPLSWHGDIVVKTREVWSDGTVCATQANGEVCFLKLFKGNRRIALEEYQQGK